MKIPKLTADQENILAMMLVGWWLVKNTAKKMLGEKDNRFCFHGTVDERTGLIFLTGGLAKASNRSLNRLEKLQLIKLVPGAWVNQQCRDMAGIENKYDWKELDQYMLYVLTAHGYQVAEIVAVARELSGQQTFMGVRDGLKTIVI